MAVVVALIRALAVVALAVAPSFNRWDVLGIAVSVAAFILAIGWNYTPAFFVPLVLAAVGIVRLSHHAGGRGVLRDYLLALAVVAAALLAAGALIGQCLV